MKDAREQFILDKLARLDGNVLAAHAAIRALILLLPDPPAASAAVLAQLEKVLSIGLGKALPEPMIEGIAEARQRLLPSPRDLGNT